MKKYDFIEKLHDAGWQGVADAQNTGIEALWKEIFPFSAELENELTDAEHDGDRLAATVDDLEQKLGDLNDRLSEETGNKAIDDFMAATDHLIEKRKASGAKS